MGNSGEGTQGEDDRFNVSSRPPLLPLPSLLLCKKTLTCTSSQHPTSREPALGGGAWCSLPYSPLVALPLGCT